MWYYCFISPRIYSGNIKLPEVWACYIVRFISVGECLGLLTRNSYYWSHSSSDHHVKSLVWDALLKCEIFQRGRMSSFWKTTRLNKNKHLFLQFHATKYLHPYALHPYTLTLVCGIDHYAVNRPTYITFRQLTTLLTYTSCYIHTQPPLTSLHSYATMYILKCFLLKTK